MKMNYVVVGTNDLTASVRFYDALFEGIGLAKVAPTERMTYWMGEDFAFAAATPFDGASATIGNGMMVGFCVGSPTEVERMHALALTLGGADEGAPCQKGPRFSGYVRDLDGNKLCLAD